MKCIIFLLLFASSTTWCADHKDTEYALQLAMAPYTITVHYDITNAHQLLKFFEQAFGLEWTTFVQNMNHQDPTIKKLNKIILINWRKIVQFLKDKYFNGLSAQIWHTFYHTLGDLIAQQAKVQVPNFEFLAFLEEHLKQIDALLIGCKKASI